MPVCRENKDKLAIVAVIDKYGGSEKKITTQLKEIEGKQCSTTIIVWIKIITFEVKLWDKRCTKNYYKYLLF